MERLTQWSKIYNRYQVDIDGIKHHGSIVDRLAEYEDTGLEPREITSMIVELSLRYKAYENLTEKNERLQKECVDTYNQMMDTEKDFQRIISESNNEIASLKQSLDELQEKYDALEDGAKNAYGLYKEYQRLEQEDLLVRLPCKVGDAVWVDSRTIPTANMDFEEDTIPKYFKATVVSYRKNAKSKYIKLKVRAGWLHEWIDSECGPDSCYCDIEKYFTYPVSAIGITVFLTEAEAEQALKGSKANEAK